LRLTAAMSGGRTVLAAVAAESSSERDICVSVVERTVAGMALWIRVHCGTHSDWIGVDTPAAVHAPALCRVASSGEIIEALVPGRVNTMEFDAVAALEREWAGEGPVQR
jgi:hypothetical protein